MLLDLDTVKKHLVVEHDEDDKYIVMITEAAEEAVSKNLNKQLLDKDGFLSKSIQQSVLFLVANFYANRESTAFTSISNIPQTFDYLIKLNRNYLGTLG